MLISLQKESVNNFLTVSVNYLNTLEQIMKEIRICRNLFRDYFCELHLLFHEIISFEGFVDIEISGVGFYFGRSTT